ncbi:MAG: hypothetical protein M3466_02970 [Gemmatimonadota bacterium]|nr:hypothetical protein [Gemmatimonadota bacterium]
MIVEASDKPGILASELFADGRLADGRLAEGMGGCLRAERRSRLLRRFSAMERGTGFGS